MKNLRLPIILLSLVLVGLFATAQERSMTINMAGQEKTYLLKDIIQIDCQEQIVSPAPVKAAIVGTQIRVKWTATAKATNYEVFRSGNGSSYTSIAKVNTNQYFDNAPLEGNNYYAVIARGDAQDSPMAKGDNPVYFIPSASVTSGLYLGIVGFNNDLTVMPMSRLSSSTSSQFTSFVSGLTSKKGTLLYHAVDRGIDYLTGTSFPDDLAAVALVTFTDGLDQGSTMKTDAYVAQGSYINAISARIKSEQVQGKSIDAYSIGLRGNDVSDTDLFKSNLKKLASSDANALEVTNMTEVNQRLQEIAELLIETTRRQNITINFAANPGTKVRFTFDNITKGADSKIYIEGSLVAIRDEDGNRVFQLRDIVYSGIRASDGSLITVVQGSENLQAVFHDTTLENGDPVQATYFKQWFYSSLGSWEPNSEQSYVAPIISETAYKPAAIILMLDCSTSLGSQFSTLKTYAQNFIETLVANTQNDPTDPEQPDTPTSQSKTYTVNGVSFKMIKVDGGTFNMGATAEQSNGYTPRPNETPVHSVTLSDYYIGETEVTQELWKAVMGASPSSSYSWESSYGLGAKYPAYYISYTECQDFITKLNQLTGATFRMPTEAEWEYAARGGSKSKGYIFSGSNTIGDVAWCYDNSGNARHPVATKAPNELGIYDMSGNVWEWCSDWNAYYSSASQTNPTGPSSGYYRVFRGGSRINNATYCRVAYRNCGYPTDHYYYLGLRLCL